MGTQSLNFMLNTSTHFMLNTSTRKKITKRNMLKFNVYSNSNCNKSTYSLFFKQYYLSICTHTYIYIYKLLFILFITE